MKPTPDYSLYLVTDRELMSTTTLEEAVSAALSGGCSLVQLREKSAPTGDFYDLTKRVKRVTNAARVPLIVNDRVDIALAADADGVHIGQTDLPAQATRRLIGDHKLLGVSVSNLEQARRAVADRVDYLGVGAMFATDTKDDAELVTLDELRAIREAVDLPIVVIGGINEHTVPQFAGLGIDGLAVVSAILSSPDIGASARRLRRAFERL